MDDVLQLPGNWVIGDDGKQYSGVLFVDKKARSVCLKLWFYGDDRESTEPFDTDFSLPYITGVTLNGKRMTLSSCVGMLMSSTGEAKSPRYTTEYHVRAKYAFTNVSIQNVDELHFVGALVDYGDIGEWARVSRITYKFDKEVKSWNWEQNGGSAIWLRDDLMVFVSAGICSGPQNNCSAQVIIEQPVRMQYYYMADVAWDRIMDDISLLKEIIEFGLNRHVELKNVETVHDSMLPPQLRGQRGFQTGFREVVYLGDRRKLVPYKIKSESVFLYLSDLQPLLQEKSAEGRERIVLIRPVLKLYLEACIYNDEMAAETVFKNLARGLEAAHRNLSIINTGCEDKKSFGDRLDDLLKPLCGECDEDFAQDVIPTLIDCIVKSRNYYTHYNPKQYDEALKDEKLVELNKKLIRVLRFYLLKMFGLSDDVALTRVGYRRDQEAKVVSQSWTIRL